MVKFSKQLALQVVPEWRAAYVNYKALKKDLKHMKQVLRDQRTFKMNPSPRVTANVLPSPRAPSDVLPSPRVSIVLPSPRVGKAATTPRVVNINEEIRSPPLDSFVALTGSAWGVHRLTRRRSQIAKDPVVQAKKGDGDASETVYETDLENLNDLDANFFVRVDAEFNKVNKFYRTKEKDFISQADVLEKQMAALVNMRRLYAEQKAQQTEASSHRTDEAGFTDVESGRDMAGSSNADDSTRRTNAFRSFLGRTKDGTTAEDSENEAPTTPLVKRGNDSAGGADDNETEGSEHNTNHVLG